MIRNPNTKESEKKAKQKPYGQKKGRGKRTTASEGQSCPTPKSTTPPANRLKKPRRAARSKRFRVRLWTRRHRSKSGGRVKGSIRQNERPIITAQEKVRKQTTGIKRKNRGGGLLGGETRRTSVKQSLVTSKRTGKNGAVFWVGPGRRRKMVQTKQELRERRVNN